MRCYLILIINTEYVQILCFWTLSIIFQKRINRPVFLGKDRTKDNVQKHNREYGLTLKMKAICSSETSVDFQRTTRRYIPEDRTLNNREVSYLGVPLGMCRAGVCVLD
jgi:hypothetical protein